MAYSLLLRSNDMLATLDELKTWLEIDDEAEDERLTQCLRAAKDLIQGECGGRELEYVDSDLTELHDGGAQSLYVAAWPIVSLSSVKYASDYDWDSSDALTADDEYRVVASRGRIERLPRGGHWTPGTEVWQVVYRGGYWAPDAEGEMPDGVTAMPGKLRQLAIELAAYWWKRKDDPAAHSEGMAGGAGNISYTTEAQMLASVRARLVGERRIQ